MPAADRVGADETGRAAAAAALVVEVVAYEGMARSGSCLTRTSTPNEGDADDDDDDDDGTDDEDNEDDDDGDDEVMDDDDVVEKRCARAGAVVAAVAAHGLVNCGGPG